MCLHPIMATDAHFAVPLSSVTDHCDGLAQRSSLCKECYLIRWHCQFNHVTDNCFDLVHYMIHSSDCFSP